LSGVKLEMVGINDTFTESGPYDTLLEKYGLSKDAVMVKVKQLLG